MNLVSRTYEAFDLLPEPVFIYDGTGAFHFVNHAGNELRKGYGGIPIRGFFDFFRNIPKEVRDIHQQLGLETPVQEAYPYETIFDADTTYFRYASISTRRIDGGGQQSIFLSQVRISEFKRENVLEQKVFAEKYESLLESTPAMIWITNRQNRPIYSNNALRRFLGVDIAAIPTQQEFENLIHPEDQQLAIYDFNTAIEQKQAFAGEFRIRTADGSFKWVLEEALPHFDKNGTYLGYQGKFVNINNQKLLQESLNKTRMEMGFLTEGGGLFIFHYHLDGSIHEVSPSCKNILGYTPEELEHVPLKNIVHPDDYAANFEPSMFYRYMEKYQTIRLRILTVKHHYKWLEIQGAFIRDTAQEVTGIVCLARDVTERIQLAEKMELSNRFLENTQSMIVITDKHQRIEWVNASFSKVSGYTLEEIIGRKPSEFLQGAETSLATKSYMRQKLEAGESFECELLNYNKQGEPYWVSFRCEPVRNDQGEIDKFFAIEEDITERKFQQNRIQIAATFPELNPNPILRITRKGEILFQNPSAKKLQQVCYQDTLYSLESFCRYIAQTTRQKVVLHEVDIDQRLFELTCVPISDSDFINIYGNDVTELSQATQLLKNSERKYRYLAENSRDLICLHNTEDELLYISPSAERLLEFSLEELIGLSLGTICHPDDATLYKEKFRAILAQQEEIITIEVRLKKKSGHYQWFELQLYPVLEDGRIAGVQSSARDITQLKFQEFRLKVNELKYRRLIDNIDLGYVEMDKLGNVTYANESFCRMTKFDSDEIIGCNPDELLFPQKEQREEIRARNDLRLKGIAEVYQIPIRRKDGIVRTLLISAAPLYSDEGNILGSAAIHWDISPMLEMEELLHDKEVQRQRSILQASIRTEEKQKQTLGRELHDGLGQLLAYISLNMQLLLDKKSDAQEIVDKTKELLNNAIAEVRQLSRTLIPVSLDSTKSLREIISESLVLFANMKGIRFEIELYRDEADRRLNVDQKHIIFRIIQELTNNTLKYSGASVIRLSVGANSRNCIVTFTDNGKGFNPKKVKKGVGFESIQNRIASYNGKLTLQSAAGKGMKASFSIPFVKKGVDVSGN